MISRIAFTPEIIIAIEGAKRRKIPILLSNRPKEGRSSNMKVTYQLIKGCSFTELPPKPPVNAATRPHDKVKTPSEITNNIKVYL